MSSSRNPDCPFCPDNGRLNIIREAPSGHTCFVQVLIPRDGRMEPAEGAYFVLPKHHYYPEEDMPFDFLHDVNWYIREHVREGGSVFDNGGFNYTLAGGRTLDHAHYWLMQAQPADEPLGLYSLRTRYREVVRNYT